MPNRIPKALSVVTVLLAILVFVLNVTIEFSWLSVFIAVVTALSSLYAIREEIAFQAYRPFYRFSHLPPFEASVSKRRPAHKSIIDLGVGAGGKYFKERNQFGFKTENDLAIFKLMLLDKSKEDDVASGSASVNIDLIFPLDPSGFSTII